MENHQIPQIFKRRIQQTQKQLETATAIETAKPSTKLNLEMAQPSKRALALETPQTLNLQYKFCRMKKKAYHCSVKIGIKRMNQKKVIERIMETAGYTLPKGASLWLYGSRARGDARPDSDYDLLILLDKDELTLDDYLVQKPLRELGWDIGEEINPQVYSKNEWESYSYTPFYNNVSSDKRVLI